MLHGMALLRCQSEPPRRLDLVLCRAAAAVLPEIAAWVSEGPYGKGELIRCLAVPAVPLIGQQSDTLGLLSDLPAEDGRDSVLRLDALLRASPAQGIP